MYEQIAISEDSGITTITLNRPEKLNALAGHMRRDLAAALEVAGSDRTVHVVVITGAGRAFCAGGDVKAMAELIERQDADEFSRLLGSARRVISAIRQMTKPVIASINGPAAGAGFNLALACDLRIASTTATFSQSFAKVGLHPDWGGTYFLPRLVTPNKACEMFFLGETMSAEEAHRLGILNDLVAPEELEAATRRLAERLRDAPAISLGAAKQAVYRSQAAELEEMLRYETEAQMRCFESEDASEGCRAFLEKREPKFTGGDTDIELPAMQVTVEIPEDIARLLNSKWANLPRGVLESLALEAYRSGTLTTAQLRRLLGFQTPMEVDAFLKQAGIYLDYGLEDYMEDLETIRKVRGE